ncbi:MAG TPA: PQQ-binding-like beta-propeller repeat protein, partial [Pilimelia sp.]|nr:PQQ-binding-like beta-propeller repeat protein [Pilimelia sp.]
LLGAVADAPAPRAVVVAGRIPAGPQDTVLPYDDRVYVLRATARTVDAHRASDGARLWRVVLPAAASDVLPGRGVLLASTDGGVLALDPASGRLRWRQPGYPAGVVPDGAGRGADLPVLSQPPANPAHGDIGRLAAVDPVTGRERWAYPAPPGGVVRLDWTAGSYHVRHLVTGLPTGRVEVRDLRTGALMAAATLRPPVPPTRPDPERPRPDWLLVDGATVLVSTSAERRDMVAYAVGSLTRRWTARWPPPPSWTLVGRCDRLLCIGDETGNLFAVDRATGALRWRAVASWAMSVGDTVVTPASAGGPRLGTEPSALLREAATGRVLHDLGGWQPVPTWAGGVVLTRQDGDSGRTWFAVLAPGDAAPRVLGSLPGLDEAGCSPVRDGLACSSPAGPVTLVGYRAT